MTLEKAREIQTWTYDEPYSLYSFTGDQEELLELMNGSYFYVIDDKRNLIGYFCYGESGQVPAGHQVDAYEENFIDIGLGLHPNQTGKGTGLAFLKVGLAYAIEKYGFSDLRLTVASFNRRAIKVYERAGFTFEKSFAKGSTNFNIMIKRNRNSTHL
ncbi:GNAT family N-acetyltransferase [Guptibacillus hwajinpoensis]|uniref:GNAT family N-acetyltransferase n=1 Tax=Guptibacillus hwajinpoensis TaxID=208199 RepID=UPI001CFDC008|nr:GNAT family protein [Pseudalkalibacillus hwajinpoensis]WLR59437.1 GNAT family protein [Pseudalkalibacillus hwajinpoensis]